MARNGYITVNVGPGARVDSHNRKFTNRQANDRGYLFRRSIGLASAVQFAGGFFLPAFADGCQFPFNGPFHAGKLLCDFPVGKSSHM